MQGGSSRFRLEVSLTHFPVATGLHELVTNLGLAQLLPCCGPGLLWSLPSKALPQDCASLQLYFQRSTYHHLRVKESPLPTTVRAIRRESDALLTPVFTTRRALGKHWLKQWIYPHFCMTRLTLPLHPFVYDFLHLKYILYLTMERGKGWKKEWKCVMHMYQDHTRSVNIMHCRHGLKNSNSSTSNSSSTPPSTSLPVIVGSCKAFHWWMC